MANPDNAEMIAAQSAEIRVLEDWLRRREP